MRSLLLSLAFFVLPLGAQAASKGQGSQVTRVIVLGVDHAAQLISPKDSPAVLAAFLERAKPDAICIERSPEAYARNDYYEFTYEVQDVVVPFARSKGLDVCPIDWMPSTEDAKLGFGMDLEAVPEVRPEKGYQQFLTFPNPSQLTRDLFHADNPDNLGRVIKWAVTPATKSSDDLPRRLYLYRTFLQAKRLSQAAKAHPGGTVLLVVGEFHKRDIEAILADEKGIEVVQPSTIGTPTRAQIAAAESRDYWLAIASFNLLGVQSTTGNIDLKFVRGAVSSLRSSEYSPEVTLLGIRLDLLESRIDSGQAVGQYLKVASSAGDASFSWTGAQDRDRLDSYFDPFGNLNVRQRSLVEAARELVKLGRSAEAERIRGDVARDLTALKARQFEAYWARYIAASATKQRE